MLNRPYKDTHTCHAYNDLKRRFRNIGRLSAIAEIISRDFLTNMPEGAYVNRLDQISYLHRRIHHDIVCCEAQDQLDTAENHAYAHPKEWSAWDSANLQGMKHTYDKHAILTHDLMEESAHIANEGRRLHREVYKTGDWETAKKHLAYVVDHTKRVAELKAKWRGSATLYDALVQDYSPGISLKQVWSWFNHLNTELQKLLPKVIDRQSTLPEIKELTGPFDKDGQMWLNRTLLDLMGFDYNRGELYETAHNPVEGGTPDDTRLVIKNVDTRDFLNSMKSALHECGHGLYIQGLPARGEWAYQPVAQDLGATMQESQALLIEMIVSRTPEFFNFLAPRLEGLFHTIRDPALTADNLYHLKTRVRPTLNRKNADELTYFFHVFVRFQIECDLIEGTIEVDDIPAMWTEKMHDLMGIAPQDNMEGVLQDVHWFVGKFGYFQSYTIGHMIAAQLFEKMQQDIPRMYTLIQQGDFKPITEWLNTHIHSQGARYTYEELLLKVTGNAPSPDFLISHLENRYLGRGR